MELSGSHHFNYDREEVWRTLNNPDALRRALPGCREFTPEGEGRYRVRLVLGFAFLKAPYKGSVHLRDAVPLQRYTLAITGEGPLGKAVGYGRFNLDEDASGSGTVVTYQGDVQVSGKIEALGHTIVRAGAHLAIGQFFAAMEREIKSTLPRNKRRAG